MAGAVGLQSLPALATDTTCSDINEGALNIALASIETITRSVSLKAGDSLTFTLESPEGAFGSLALVSGAGSPRALLAGAVGTKVSFTAPTAGTYDFEFVAEAEEGAGFAATCLSAAEARRKSSPAARRTARLLAANPGLAEVVTDEEVDGSPAFEDNRAATAQPQRMDAAIASASRSSLMAVPAKGLDVWLQGQDRRYSLLAAPPAQDAGSGVMSGGGLDYKLLPNIMVGALVQFEQFNDSATRTSLSPWDRGWMAGPMTTLRLAPGLSLDARAAWGAAETGVYGLSGSSTDRRLVRASVSDTQVFGRWRFSPSINVNYLEEKQRIVDPSAHEALLSRSGSGRVDVRPEVGYRFDAIRGTYIEPKAALTSFWDFDSLSTLGPREEIRLKAEAGVVIGTNSGTKVQATGGVEEGSAGTASTWSGRLQFNVPLK